MLKSNSRKLAVYLSASWAKKFPGSKWTTHSLIEAIIPKVFPGGPR
jgi:hypothetical protein